MDCVLGWLGVTLLKNSPSGLTWPYPLSSPSPRFLRMNNFVRSLDVRYNALSSAQKKTWKDFADGYPWVTYCLDDIYDVPFDGYLAGTGVQAFRSVNCFRLDQGLSVTLTAPSFATARDNDTISLFYSSGWYIQWGGRSDFPLTCYSADIRYAVSNNVPTSGPAVSKFVYNSTVNIDYQIPLLIIPAPVGPPPPVSMITYTLGVAIGDCNGAPFFGARVSFP